WTGSVTSSKWDAAEAICESNKIANENELAMFNSYFGTTREFNTTDDNLNIFLDLKEGEEWATGKSFVVVVKECAMNTAKNTLGDYDLCLSYRGTNIAKYEEIAVGDELTIKYAWKSCATSDEPELTQLVSGNAMVLFNGELTDRNYNESYNTTVYSRTGYGMSEDGKTLFNIVIDKSTDAVYGTSAGCSTAVMGQIMQQLGCWNLTTMDAGGSAQMLIEGEVINKTTEGTPRAVANGWMLFSTAPRDTEIAEIKFADYDVTLPIYSSYKPLVYGYNQYGDLVNEDLQGIILSCDEQVGYINGDLFNASSAAATGELTISYNGIEASKMVTVVDGAMSFRVENIIIDKLREYPIEVLADCGDGEEYICDPARFQWSIEDESIVSIDEDGVLRGLMVGNTTISGALDEFNGSANVSVEIPSDDKLYQGFEDWTITGSGASSFSLNGDGELSFTYSSGRNPYITMSKEIDLYSLPERVVLDFTSTLPFSSVLIDCRTAEMTYSNYITYSEDDDYAAGENHKLVIELSEICDIEDLLMFPISLHAIKLNVGSGATTGDNTITINGLYAEYAEGSSGVVAVMGDKDAKVSIYPNPVEDGIMMISSSDVNMAKVDIYNLSGGLVKSVNLVINGGCATVDVSNLTPNMYIVKVSDGLVNEVNKVIIK
ncbi:MAG: phosphodiester glycosidase family protein, partial [Bacteroidales bacterium]